MRGVWGWACLCSLEDCRDVGESETTDKLFRPAHVHADDAAEEDFVVAQALCIAEAVCLEQLDLLLELGLEGLAGTAPVSVEEEEAMLVGTQIFIQLGDVRVSPFLARDSLCGHQGRQQQEQQQLGQH